MSSLLTALLILQIFPFWGAAGDGRRGNALYAQEEYGAAVDAYRSGLAALDDSLSGPTAAALWNNLGAARFRQSNYDEAAAAFRRSMEAATTDEAFVRAAYNAGNAAFAMTDRETALARYRDALLADPSHDDARYNYEFVKRGMKQQEQEQNQQNQDSSDDLQPSDYAKALKERADALVAQHRYREAHRLMIQGRKVDRTVGAYQQFIQRVDDVASIDESQPAAQPQP